ncbi:MAG: NAD-glutamate dehydrogenase, partial [Rhodospirillaceae bacterium]|nr:NAD-glutamate dehydrogenase [Rhodospirillaceae bacterium]
MGSTSSRKKTDLIKKIIAATKAVSKRKPSARQEKFIRQFFANSPLHDLDERKLDTLAGVASSAWNLAQKRKPGETKIRVFNPTKSTDGWDSDRTLIEVVMEDMPFLVDSVTANLAQSGITVLQVTHPILRSERGKDGSLKEILSKETSDVPISVEAVMSFEVTQLTPAARLKDLLSQMKSVLNDVRAAVEDWQPVRTRVQDIISEIKLQVTANNAGVLGETQDFLQWAHDNNFTFLGYREYDFTGNGTKLKAKVNPKSGLGILRDADRIVFKELRNMEIMPVEVRNFVRRRDPVVISKADVRSTVHRSVLLDTIGVKKYDKSGKVVGERLIVGLFTSVAYNSSPSSIPFLRRKVDTTVARAGFPPASHDGKALMNILETFPRDELFQIQDENLLEISMGILHLQERQRVALFVRPDDFSRFVSCLIFVPRDQFTTQLRIQVQEKLEEAFNGEVSGFNMEFTEMPLARLHVTISTPGGKSKVNLDNIEAELSAMAQSWSDDLGGELVAEFGEDTGIKLVKSYSKAFPPSYTENFDASVAVADISRLEQVADGDDLNLHFYHRDGSAKNEVRFKVFHPARPLPLSDVLPMLEDMGLKVIDEVPHIVRPGKNSHDIIMIHDFGLVTRDGSAVDVEKSRANFHEVFSRVWHGEMESDGFNSLVLGAGLSWREIIILRTYAKYLKQAKAPFSQKYMEQALCNNTGITSNLVKIFQTHFDPALQDGHNRKVISLQQKILSALDQVESADEDRILRRFLNAIDATLRTNFYQTAEDGSPKSYLAVKLDSHKIDELPLPRPLREIFVYSPRFEAVHLRGGMVARGGLRWSDRPEDFRTEILGLMKAQMVKNTVIVPVGSKGGFVVKRPPVEGGREAFLEEGIACYKMFMGGLLDITDNYQGTKIIAPKDVIRRDENDPYLVVAADKGTATFSDIANGVSIERGFWLGDAYASGGSIGYDHKKMGITARGAWESVKRHFREIGKDIQNETFSAIGVGDMSGDVFGNGMLLSKQTQLIAAFNHMHIFIDPNPDPAKSFAERKRLFNLTRSSWTDYNASLISKGGGIFERSAKSINLSSQIRARFGFTKSSVTPNELIKMLLTAETELLWFGGIGSYIKASSESHGDADDRANDAVRIDAKDLRCQVIGEGANLGATQLGRIEYALNGGRLNTDSVDNSAGVDCSDHEVNIKILVDSVVAKGRLTGPQRNKLLEKMTDEVGHLVLRDNYLQSQAISLMESQDTELFDLQARFIREMERAGRLDRSVEFLPDEEMLQDREKENIGLTRPEISIVMPYSKLWFYDVILDSDLPDAQELQQDLIDYFPTNLRKTYRKDILQHRLRREIIATIVTNSLINRVGGTFVASLNEKTGTSPVEIAKAFIATRDAFGLEEIWAGIEALDNKVSADTQNVMLKDVNQLIERATLWFLRNTTQPMDIGDNIKEFATSIKSLSGRIESILPDGVTDRVNFRANRYTQAGVPQGLAKKVAYLLLLVSSLDIVRTAASCNMKLEAVAKLYFEVGEALGLGWLRYNAEKLPGDNHWQKLASAAVIEELYSHQRGITARVVDNANGATDPLAEWQKSNTTAMD